MRTKQDLQATIAHYTEYSNDFTEAFGKLEDRQYLNKKDISTLRRAILHRHNGTYIDAVVSIAKQELEENY